MNVSIVFVDEHIAHVYLKQGKILVLRRTEDGYNKLLTHFNEINVLVPSKLEWITPEATKIENTSPPNFVDTFESWTQ